MINLNFFKKNKLPVLYQTESAECGLVSIAMIASYYGHNINLVALRMQYCSHYMGSRLGDLVSLAKELNFHTRAVKVELDEIKNLRMPCILHWELNHFVVLSKVTKNYFEIHDPALGRRIISHSKMNTSFTGIALECTPSQSFQKVHVANVITLKDILRWMPNINKPLLNVMFMSMFIELMSLTSPLYMQLIVDDVLINSDKEFLLTIIIVSIIILITNILISSVRSWAILTLSTLLNSYWLRNVFSYLLSLPMSFFEKRQIGDITSRFNSATSIQQTITSYFIESFLDGLMAIGTLFLMFIYSVKLSIVAIVALIIYTVIRFVWYGYLKELTEEQLVINAKEDSYFIETLRGIQSLKVFQKTNERESIWINLLTDGFNIGIKLEKANVLYKFVNSMTSGVNQSMMLWLGASLVMENKISVGMYMAFMAYSIQFSIRMSSLVDNLISLKMIRLHIDRLSDIILSKPEEDNAGGVFPSDFQAEIEFKKVFFRYSKEQPFIIKDLSFKVSPGEVVALTGPSGCGKSTILKLILGFYQPESGDILVSGVSIKHWNKDALREKISCVMQDDILFNCSIYDNIAFMDISHSADRVIQASRLAFIDDKINTLPMGYNTVIGDIGCFLSGGQQQRIILARALYKMPRIILLDEATSNLDSDTENKINEMINNLGLTALVVAHRKETIDSAQRIIHIK
ncbi:peptidase domain-containing ABC transporter [Aeromonas veronii]|uniref:peptidase domain-containing ABC transporter n=1 Tax=Aeromonas veronii TaxID=654 RepID=UPI003BA2D37B